MGKRKLHKIIDNVEHKYCYMCKKWKLLDKFSKRGNGKQSYCKPCRNKENRQRYEKRKKEHEAARGTGFLVCLNESCTVKQWLQPLNQFISAHVRNNKPTKCCLTCRTNALQKQKRRYAACQKVYDDWRKTHPCVICSQDPNYEHNYLLIEADHLPEFEKVEKCSEWGFWSVKCRGPDALRAELMKCQALCRFHHRLQTQQRRHDNGSIRKDPWVLRKRGIINAEKHKRGCCSNPKCKRVLKKGEECAFDFDHRDDSTKFKYKGETIQPSSLVRLPDALFDIQWPLEKELVDLLCANCHTLKSKGNKDGYRK